jgi:hypothetical protein
MNDKVKYVCSCCGKEHFEWPALAFMSPDNYDHLSEEDKKNIAELDADFCTINYPDEVSRFIRCTLTQKVIDHCEDLEYGLWVSLSEKSFNSYSETFGVESPETTYFGWLCNQIPGYKFDEGIPTTVITRSGNHRPEIVPHEGFNHPFVNDYYNGISKSEAESRIKAMLEMVEQGNASKKSKKPWWKFGILQVVLV